MTKLECFPKALRKVLEDDSIVKVFHDFIEDSSALAVQHNVICDRVFDT
jgi:ribonuclease D